MKIRKIRYQYRAILKENSNRHNTISSEHPQVYRQIEEEDVQRDENEWQDIPPGPSNSFVVTPSVFIRTSNK